jgi:hypothetical protein
MKAIDLMWAPDVLICPIEQAHEDVRLPHSPLEGVLKNPPNVIARSAATWQSRWRSIRENASPRQRRDSQRLKLDFFNRPLKGVAGGRGVCRCQVITHP